MAKQQPLTDLECKAMTALARVYDKDFKLTQGRATPFPTREQPIATREEIAYLKIAMNSKKVTTQQLEEWARL
ncbi:hypothetical protein ACMGE6_10590 [Macrococcus equi]|uniref:hypothetical protein n=1 Tax=Macrococcus equi TaxID=3395462 RepID=UPI0039BDF837